MLTLNAADSFGTISLPLVKFQGLARSRVAISQPVAQWNAGVDPVISGALVTLYQWVGNAVLTLPESRALDELLDMQRRHLGAKNNFQITLEDTTRQIGERDRTRPLAIGTTQVVSPTGGVWYYPRCSVLIRSSEVVPGGDCSTEIRSFDLVELSAILV